MVSLVYDVSKRICVCLREIVIVQSPSFSLHSNSSEAKNLFTFAGFKFARDENRVASLSVCKLKFGL